MIPKRIPEAMLVARGGAIGIEFAFFYSALGSKVVVVEVLPHILAAEDDETAKFALVQFERQGIAIRTSASVANTKRAVDGRLVATVENGGATKDVVADAIIVATGVRANIENLGIEELGVRPDRGGIAVDGYGRTGIQGLYPIGDVVGAPMLAHKADHEGIVCVEAIYGIPTHPLDPLRVPACTYSGPQIASVGLTGAKARTAGYDVRVGRFPFAGNGKATALGEDGGLVKTVFDVVTGRLQARVWPELRSRA